MKNSHSLTARICREIAAEGVISFARFMELALYEPGLGYYEVDPDSIGQRGDFCTSVSVGPLLGELLAFQFAEWAEAAPEDALIQWVEAGAHEGRLAMDILSCTRRQRPELAARLQYWLVEPSARRRDWQSRSLADFPGQVHWAEGLAQVPAAGFRILFCNELLDAFPVHRFGWDAAGRCWREWGVSWRGGRFQWTKMPDSLREESQAPAVPEELKTVLPDGYIAETCPRANNWWREAAETLGHGWLMTIDYGFTQDELWAPERLHGTLRAYRRHACSDDLLSDPGQQDLTAHVDFACLRRIGEQAGLRTEDLVSQSQFLTGLAARQWDVAGTKEGWTPRRARELQTLIHPAHFGRAFRVLTQSRLPAGNRIQSPV